LEESKSRHFQTDYHPFIIHYQHQSPHTLVKVEDVYPPIKLAAPIATFNEMGKVRGE
jgi:hypothetical protein